MEDGIGEPPSKRQREAGEDTAPEAVMPAGLRTGDANGNAGSGPAAAHSPEPQQFPSDSGGMSDDGDDSSDAAGDDTQTAATLQQEHIRDAPEQQPDLKQASQAASKEPDSAAQGGSTGRLSAPAGALDAP